MNPGRKDLSKKPFSNSCSSHPSSLTHYIRSSNKFFNHSPQHVEVFLGKVTLVASFLACQLPHPPLSSLSGRFLSVSLKKKYVNYHYLISQQHICIHIYINIYIFKTVHRQTFLRDIHRRMPTVVLSVSVTEIPYKHTLYV